MHGGALFDGHRKRILVANPRADKLKFTFKNLAET